MLTFTTAGFFGLTSGCHIHTEVAKTNGTTQGVYYIYYITSMNCSVSGPISAKLHKYSPLNDTVLADNTIAFMIAKVYSWSQKVTGNSYQAWAFSCPVSSPFHCSASLIFIYTDSVVSYLVLGLSMVV